VKQNFYINNEAFIREYSIKKYVYTTPSQTLYNSVKIMLHTNYHTNKLIIHAEFPKNMLVNIFRPYLFYYYVIHYSIKGTEKIHKYKNQLHIKLRQFYEYNNLFGRKICFGFRRKKENKKPFSFKFNSEHINFYNIAVNNSKCEFEPKTNIINPLVIGLNRVLHPQYDSDELFYSSELNNEEYNTDYEDNENE